MKEYLVTKIPIDSFFTKPVYLDNSFVIASPEMPFSETYVKFLDNWNIKVVYSAGDPMDHYTPDIPGVRNSETGTAKTQGIVSQPDTISDEDTEKMQQAESFYKSFEDYTKMLLLTVSLKNEINLNSVADYIKTVIAFVRDNYRYLMRLQKEPEAVDNKGYIISQSARTTIMAITIGNQLKLLPHRLIELGISSLLHELGMLQLPAEAHMPKRQLSAHERRLLETHPVLGFNKLKLLGAPMPICSAVLEHHERENGTGYPRQLPGEKIGLSAKILAVASSYEALTSKRPHRSAKDSYTAIIELLKNENKQYDDSVIQALVYSLSIFPIGLYVLLSNGKKGQVVDVNIDHPKYPIVQVFNDPTPDGKNKVVETAPHDIHILRPLTQQEINS